MLGTIGENERMDGTVISGVVNLASRIEGIAKEYSIGLAVSERILLGLDDPNAYHLRFLGKVPVKGTREPGVSVFGCPGLETVVPRGAVEGAESGAGSPRKRTTRKLLSRVLPYAE